MEVDSDNMIIKRIRLSGLQTLVVLQLVHYHAIKNHGKIPSG